MKSLMTLLFLCCVVALSFPTNGYSHGRGYGGHHDGYAGRGYSYGGHRGNHPGYYSGRHHHQDDFSWGATGFLLGAAFGAALYPPPVYGYGPPVYYPPPPMCRYDRYVTDYWGRTYTESYMAPCR